jgi:SAM-dependent methyltransferase
VAEFDRLAEVYDDAISSFEIEEAHAIARVLNETHSHRLLEVGIGTGLVSKPLQEDGFETIGIDISLPMLLKAKSKGVENLILADARHLPIRSKIFDATILVDVLNCLESPLQVFNEIVAVTRNRIIAIKRKYDRAFEQSEIYDPKFARLRERVAKYTPWPIDFNKSWRKEDNILRLYPPTQRAIVSNRIIETTAESMISRLERGAFRFTSSIPERDLRTIAMELRYEMKGSYFRRRRIREMVVWDAGQVFSSFGQ